MTTGDAGAATPVGPVIGGGGIRSRAVLAVVAVAAVVISFGLGLQLPPLGPPSSASSTPSTSATSAAIPSPTRDSRPGPAGPVTAAGCRPATTTDDPDLLLGAAATVEGGLRGVIGIPGPVDGGNDPATWPIPPGEDRLVIPAGTALAVSAGGTCLVAAAADVAALDASAGTVQALRPAGPVAPGPTVELAALPGGEWIVRVKVTYEALAGAGGVRRLERWFRVEAGGAAGPTPAVTPAVPCGSLPADAAAPRLRLAIGDGPSVAGLDLATSAGVDLHAGPVVSGGLGRLTISSPGDACATSWRVIFWDPVSARPIDSATEADVLGRPNVADDPYLVAQDRLVLTSVPVGRTALIANVSFGHGRQITMEWQLDLSAPVPSARVAESDGASVEAAPGCGSRWRLADGTSGVEVCGDAAAGDSGSAVVVPSGTPILVVPVGIPVQLAVPGWAITGWGAWCSQDAHIGASFGDTGRCSLGGSASIDGSDLGPARVLPLPGRSIIAFSIAIRQGTTSLTATYFVAVVATA